VVFTSHKANPNATSASVLFCGSRFEFCGDERFIVSLG
jgi:hypothetical protein